ncbi:hypothetical protein BDA99DRAFT_518306 [Phascolomyces articulosus]|uniref:Uncharacterized protein n=1 Tax=Phascolomyces articulosus TaxID=60185 RepID=A0AAD5JV64_9FUNG|nr:hypothetical protein BDA99DRAFT_518306 [Phascolomyces articulosus]
MRNLTPTRLSDLIIKMLHRKHSHAPPPPQPTLLFDNKETYLSLAVYPTNPYVDLKYVVVHLLHG